MKQARDLTPETIENPKTRRVLDYWLSKRAGREMPSRADIEPLELRDVLGNLCLADVTDETPPRFRFRVDGSNLAAMTGFDMTGKYADQLPHPHYRDYVLELYARVVETRAPVIRANEEEWAGYGMRVESVTLPLSSDGRRVDAILDAVFPYDH
jgi:hypothetical protein